MLSITACRSRRVPKYGFTIFFLFFLLLYSLAGPTGGGDRRDLQNMGGYDDSRNCFVVHVRSDACSLLTPV